LAVSVRAGAPAQAEEGVAALARHPHAFLGLAVLLTAVLSLGIVGVQPLGLPGLQTDAGVELLADPGSPGFADQVLYADSFGADPVVILVEAPRGRELMTGDHFIGLAALEGKLADPKAHPGVKRVYGPGTVVNTLALEVTKRGLEICATAAKAAETSAVQQAAAAGKSAADQQAAGQAAFDASAKSCANQLAAQYPSLGVPALNNPGFIKQVLLEPDGTKTRPYWSWAMPDPQHALITVRMDRHASLADVRGILATVDAARHRPPTARSAAGSTAVTPAGDLSDLRLSVTGAPVLTTSLADDVQGWLLLLLPLTLVAMLLVTLFVLRLPLRLLAVPLAALAAYWTAGAAGLARLPITPATMAVLPVVLGLATDYTLQCVNRLADEESGGPTGRVVRAARAILPPTGIAALATIAGVLAFAFSPLPLLRQFAFFLAIGVVMAYLAAFLVGVPLFALVLSSDLRRFIAAPRAKPAWPILGRLGSAPLRVVVPLILIGLLGWAALPLLRIETDPNRLMPAGDPALAQADHVRQAVGLAGEVDIVMTGPAVASPAAIQWLDSATRAVVAAEGGRLRPETSLPSFLAAFNQGSLPDAQLTTTILQRMPPYFTGAVLNTDRGVSRSVLGLTSLTSVEEDGRIVAGVNRVPPPPTGYRAFPAGLSVIASDALAALRQDLLRLNLLALGFVLAVLLVAFRRLRPALVAVLPTAVAAGWATGLLVLLHLASSPITVLLAGVVVAFATEFSVLWLMRYESARKAGSAAAEASLEASLRVGPAIVASALALVVGFAVLAVSPVPMVRDFGLWSGADLLLATVAVLVLLPPLARRIMVPPA
jgi:hydrophobe/amphiphile efflux-3 (HAE3) family protein